MTKSANDVEKIVSVIIEDYVLNNKTWLLSILEDSEDSKDSKEIKWLLEKRSSQGDHIIYKFS